MDTFLDKFPPNIERAVDRLMEDMSFADKTRLANMNEAALVRFHHAYGHFIRTEFRLPGNDPLMQSCKTTGHIKVMTAEQASYLILKKLQDRLSDGNILKVVK